MKKRKFRSLALGGLLALGALPSAWAQVPELAPAQTVIDRQVERAQAQAAERAVRQAEAVQDRASERAEAQAQSVQNQTVDRVQSQVERARAQAAEQAQERVERVQSQAAERARDQVERVQSQAVERVQGQAERVQSQAAERAGEQVERARQQAGRPGEGLPALDRAASERAAGALENGNAQGTAGGLLGQQAGQPGLPERLPIVDGAGNSAFVEITLEPNVRAVEYEWVMLLNQDQRRQLDAEAPDLLEFLAETRPFDATDSQLLTFRVPPDLDADDAILQLVPDELRDLIDRNHIYSAQTEEQDPGAAPALLSLPLPPVCENRLAIGIIDSAIDSSHPAFAGMAARGTRLHRQNFIQGTLAQPEGHGTAVAGLLVGEGGELRPALPGATLYSAAAVHGQDARHQGATLIHLLAALDWLIAQDLQVINMSLAGPPNRLLARGIAAAAASGKVIVAAAGNEGPHGPPRYPAAYEQVISATAVARDRGIYRWANQNEHVDYAALGVSVPTARSDGGFGPESGTSMAAPLVSAFLACALAHSGSLEQALAQLQSRLVDLGAPGRDPVYGHGLLHP